MPQEGARHFAEQRLYNVEPGAVGGRVDVFEAIGPSVQKRPRSLEMRASKMRDVLPVYQEVQLQNQRQLPSADPLAKVITVPLIKDMFRLNDKLVVGCGTLEEVKEPRSGNPTSPGSMPQGEFWPKPPNSSDAEQFDDGC